jgi:O-antigen/teichoic acid export membrane protein
LASGRGFLEAAFLPGLLGFEALGLLGRASALFGSSVSRVVTIASETVYPVLPSVAGERARFEKYAGLYAQSTILIAVMGAIFFGALGPEVSRVLYGPRWAAADPLLWPAAVLSTGLSASLIGGNILLSQNRLKICLGLSIAACAVAVPGIVAAARGNVVTYAWFVATGEFFVGGVSVLLAGIELGRRWFRLVLTPVAVCAPAGLICLALTRPLLYVVPPAIALGLRALCYGLIIVAVLRVFCPELFNQMRNIVRPTAVSLPLQTSHVGAEESR